MPGYLFERYGDHSQFKLNILEFEENIILTVSMMYGWAIQTHGQLAVDEKKAFWHYIIATKLLIQRERDTKQYIQNITK